MTAVNRAIDLTPIPPEHVIVLRCLNCGKEREFDDRSKDPVVTGEFNFFCDGECEDRYAARL